MPSSGPGLDADRVDRAERGAGVQRAGATGVTGPVQRSGGPPAAGRNGPAVRGGRAAQPEVRVELVVGGVRPVQDEQPAVRRCRPGRTGVNGAGQSSRIGAPPACRSNSSRPCSLAATVPRGQVVAGGDGQAGQRERGRRRRRARGEDAGPGPARRTRRAEPPTTRAPRRCRRPAASGCWPGRRRSSTSCRRRPARRPAGPTGRAAWCARPGGTGAGRGAAAARPDPGRTPAGCAPPRRRAASLRSTPAPASARWPRRCSPASRRRRAAGGTASPGRPWDQHVAGTTGTGTWVGGAGWLPPISEDGSSAAPLLTIDRGRREAAARPWAPGRARPSPSRRRPGRRSGPSRRSGRPAPGWPPPRCPGCARRC